MEDIRKLRNLIWDIENKVFPEDDILEEYLSDCNNNVYRTAALILDIVRANPERITQYKRGGVSITKQSLDKAIIRYQKMAGDSILTTTGERGWPDGTTQR